MRAMIFGGVMGFLLAICGLHTWSQDWWKVLTLLGWTSACVGYYEMKLMEARDGL